MQTTDALNRFQDRLKKSHASVTPSRTKIFAVFLNVNEPMTIQDIINHLPTIHYVTVYRTIEKFVQYGILTQVPIGFKNKYELSETFKPHHHHITCEVCGKTIQIDDKSIENHLHQLTLLYGLEPTRHHVEAYGICRECKKEP